MGNNPSSTAKGSDRAGSNSAVGVQQRERSERRRHHNQHTEQYYGERHKPPSSVTRNQNQNQASNNSHSSNNNVQEPRRRESLQALSSSAKAQAAPPSLTSAVAQSTSANSSTQARSIPPSTHSRTRSQAGKPPRSNPTDTINISPRSSMGAAQSLLPDGDLLSPSATKTSHLKAPSPPPEPHLSPASQPVDVPLSAANTRSFDPSPLDPIADSYHLPPSSFSRPPRMPLPIEEEVHTPGSPIVSPLDHGNIRDDLPRRSSIVSSTVDDEEEEPDHFEGYSTEHAGPKVPTIIEWKPAKPNDRVYVTGTFTNWERKFRLYKDGPSKHKDALSATLQLPPGTHHIKFIANGDMVTSEALPTTVDYTNILVNYIEVSLDQIKAVEAAKSASVTPTPVPAGPPAPSRPVDIRPKPVEPTAESLLLSTAPQHTPTYIPPSQPKQQNPPSPSPKSPNPEKGRPQPTATLVRLPPKNYTSQIPQYLLDLDTYIPSGKDHEQSPAAQAARYRIERANAAADSQPAPPSLPMFLSKSILNGTTPMKDDSSVLIMPNHTVLNHLATTNIKQGVLATSATTRYKRKFLTTIMYKPRSDDGD